MVLIHSRNYAEDYYGSPYMVLGLATDSYAVFPVIDGKIIDQHGVLRQDKNEIAIADFKQALDDFVHKTAGVPYEN